jgi:hypothetical protein
MLAEQEDHMRKQLDEISQTKRLLEVALNTNLEQQHADPEAETLLQELTTIDRSRCRPLCEGMQRYLPRELRDMVYEHVVGPTSRHNNNHKVYVQSPKNSGTREVFVLTRMYHSVFDVEQLDHMGHKTWQELVEHWYTTCTFDFGTNIHLIEAFLKGDVADSGLHALDLVHQLAITLVYNRDTELVLDERRIVGALAHLALLERPARLRIILDGIVRQQFVWMIDKVLRLLPILPGWTIEFLIEILTDRHPPMHPNISDTVPGYHVRLLIPGDSTFTPHQWTESYKQVCDDLTMFRMTRLTLDAKLQSEFEQYYNAALDEPSDKDDVDYGNEEDDYSTGSEDHSEGHTDDEWYEQLQPRGDEIIELHHELNWCRKDKLNMQQELPVMHDSLA